MKLQTPIFFLAKKPFCICFRYDFSQHEEGDFGFKNEAAHDFLNNLLNKILLIKNGDFEILKKNVPIKNGLYLYNDERKFIHLESELINYSKSKKKQEILQKRGGAFSNRIEIPFLLSSNSDSVLNVEYLNYLITNDYPFFIRTFYTPQAGETLIFFNHDVDKKIKDISTDMKIDYVEFSDISDIRYP